MPLSLKIFGFDMDSQLVLSSRSSSLSPKRLRIYTDGGDEEDGQDGDEDTAHAPTDVTERTIPLPASNYSVFHSTPFVRDTETGRSVNTSTDTDGASRFCLEVLFFLSSYWSSTTSSLLPAS